MKFTQVLYKQHIGRMTRKLWYIRRERNIGTTKAEEYLSKFGVQVKDPSEIINHKVQHPRITVDHLIPKIVFDKTHPDWKAQACLVFKDHNVLQEGLYQAQLLTNTVSLPDGYLSSDIEDSLPELPEHIDDIVERAIYTSHIFDAHQEKLSIRKDPARPAWVFPRDYGITSARKMKNMSRRFLQLCELLSGPDIAQKRCIIYDGITKLNLEKDSDFMQFTLRSDVMVTSASPLKPIKDSINNVEIDLPSIHPMHYTISLDKTYFYKTEDIYPISASSPWVNVHTIFVHYDPVEVKNLTELAVTESQILSRAMIKSYTAAASCARQRFGSSVKKLPEPVTVQCIHTNGRNYHFFVYQLNSLDVNDTNAKNFWYALPSLTLFEKAQYDNGRPVVEGYNPEVFRRILAFYRNGN